MTIDEILEAWGNDKINPLDIEASTHQIPKLHHKYLTWLTTENLRLKKLEADLRILNTQKWEFLSEGPNEETNRKGWTLPPKGVIIKAQVQFYLDADEELNTLKLKIAYQQEKVDALREIIKMLHARNYQITNILNHRKFEAGG